MGNSIYGIGLTGLAAAQAGLATTGHNIANAATAGYSRQEIVQGTNPALFTGAGYFGQGTNVETVRRVYNEFLIGQARDAQTSASELATHSSQIAQLDGVLSDAAAGLSPALNDFFNGVQTLASNPSSIPARQALLSSASALAARFQSVDARMAQLRDGVNAQIGASVNSIDAYARRIADVNHKISLAEATGHAPNDLLDQRDQLIDALNKEVRVTGIRQDDGSINLFVGNGQALVVGNTAFALQAVRSPYDPSQTEVAYVAGGSTQLLGPGVLTGGALGAALEFRSATLDSARNTLGNLAIVLADTFNAQHQLGQDLNGALGGAFFDVAAPEVFAGSGNTGNAAIGAAIADAQALTTSDYRLAYDGTNYTLTRLTDGNSQTFAALPQTVDGLTLTLASGAAAAGDRFLIRPTAAGARDLGVAISDTARIAAAAPIRASAAAANLGSAQISAGSVNAPPPPSANLQQPVTLTFTSAAAFDVSGTGTGNPTGVAYVAGGAITYNGWTVRISGTPAAGDTFTIGPNTGGVGDNRNALALGALQMQKLAAGGNATYQGAYSALVAAVGSKARELQVTSEAQDNLAAQAAQARENASGVNLDEEAANLLRYQEAYQASAKLMKVADTMFNTLLALGD